MAGTCDSCGGDIENESDFFECDGCAATLHISCDKCNVDDVNQRKGSDRLRIFCIDCVKDTDTITSENIKTLLKFIHKIDMRTQENSVANDEIKQEIARIKSAIVSTKDAVVDIKKSSGGGVHIGAKGTATYASVVRTQTKPAVIMKPKQQQKSMDTMNDIKSKVNYRDVDICGVSNVRGGGVLLKCNDNKTSLEMKQKMIDNFGDKYDVYLPQMMKPRVKIINAMNDMDDNEIVDEVKRQNSWLDKNDDIVLKKVIKKKNNKYDDVDIALEMNNECFDKFMEAEKVIVGWKSCRVVHHVHITRCYNCCGFGHISTQCKNKIACRKCGGEHKSSDCSAQSKPCCINCKVMCDKFKLKLDYDHHAFSYKCGTLMKKIERFAKRFGSSDDK